MRLLLSVLPGLALLIAFACNDETTERASGAGGTSSSTSGVGGDPPTDAASTGVGGGADPNITVTTSPCSSTTTCTLTLSGSGFDAHDGKTLHWGLLEGGSLAFESSGMIAAGAFSFSEAVLNNGSTYYLQFYVDANENMSCDAPPADPVWRVDLSTIHQDFTVEVVFNESSFEELGCTGF
jgi:hypothetical protein